MPGGTAHALQDPPLRQVSTGTGVTFLRAQLEFFQLLLSSLPFLRAAEEPSRAEHKENHMPGMFKLYHERVGKRSHGQQPTTSCPAQLVPCLGLPRELGKKDMLLHEAPVPMTGAVCQSESPAAPLSCCNCRCGQEGRWVTCIVVSLVALTGIASNRGAGGFFLTEGNHKLPPLPPPARRAS